MQKRILLSVLSMICLIPCSAQSWNEIITHSSIYLYGSGVGATVEEADQQALNNLISKISIVVSSNFDLGEEESIVNDKIDSKSYANLKIETYSAATLTNTERIVIETTPDGFHIGRYIKRSEINRIFEGRIRTLKEYVRLGGVAEQSLKIDDALRDYYWAYSLLKSVQHPAEVVYENEEDGSTMQLLTWLPEKLNSILSNLDAKVTSNDGTNVNLLFTYQGTPVSSLDFTFFDGRDWSNISSAKDGVGCMEFMQGMVPSVIQLNYEYAYRSQAHINPEMKAVLGVVKSQALTKARVQVNAQVQTANVAAQTATVGMMSNLATNTAATANNTVAAITDNSGSVADVQAYKTTLDILSNAIAKRSYDGIDQYFTPDGLEMFNKLIRYGNARVVNDEWSDIYAYRDYVVVRGIQMSFSFKQGTRKNFVEDIVFTFNSDKQIDCIAFGLGQKAKEDILGKTVWPLQARQALMEFLENYKTAYALKRLDYLKTIFDDNAVIIVGHVAKIIKTDKYGDGQTTLSTHQNIERTLYSKEQYMERLEHCFGSQEFINIRFANNDIRKAARGEEYGIQIKQDYYSSTYGDEGYLYLQVDINNPNEPIIKVRTWQPEPDPEIGLYGIGNW